MRVAVGAHEKTKNLVRKDLPVGLLVKNEMNANKMGTREFDLLVDNLERTGLTDPILVRPVSGGKYRIVGGHHRFDAAVYLGFDEVPCTIIKDASFDEDQEKFQLVRMNAIRGKLDPTAFFNLYQSLSESYSDEILQDAFGFAEEMEFRRLIDQTSKMLPDKQSQQKFKEAAKEIKTIDGLSKLLNEMFTKYGDTLPFGYMVFDYGGQRSVWLRIESKSMKALDVICDMCIDNRRTVDDVIGRVLQLIASPDSKEFMTAIVAETPEVPLAGQASAAPTKDHLAKLAAVA
jgi:hypothetical protein